jgi:hypothetical protein
LCLTQDKVGTYGIPNSYMGKGKLGHIWGSYFTKQWIPILSSWNVRQCDRSIL